MHARVKALFAPPRSSLSTSSAFFFELHRPCRADILSYSLSACENGSLSLGMKVLGSIWVNMKQRNSLLLGDWVDCLFSYLLSHFYL